MSGDASAERVAAILDEHGMEMTLTRLGGASVTVKGKRWRPDGAGSDDLAGNQAQNIVRVMISNTEIAAASWPGPPRKGDKLVMASKTYTLEADADTREDSGVTHCHFLLVKGG